MPKAPLIFQVLPGEVQYVVQRRLIQDGKECCLGTESGVFPAKNSTQGTCTYLMVPLVQGRLHGEATNDIPATYT
jgi:hypothetical protein